MEPCDSGSLKDLTTALVVSQANVGPAAGNSVIMRNCGAKIAKECKNLNEPVDSTAYSKFDCRCVNPQDAAINDISKFANCTSGFCTNASSKIACWNGQTASFQQPFKHLYGAKPVQNFPTTWNRSKVFKIDDVSKVAVMSDDGSSI
ncbi:hypothetical protein M5K25_021043 [Dendrobium thyrsiflorum]|uniref:Uncharacterized protein n=1 Tax=Dendrobium thyrsiflorum TaxID=117978 RepID=A0ABD0UBH5_DENTH